jgi:hypothetical protein
MHQQWTRHYRGLAAVILAALLLSACASGPAGLSQSATSPTQGELATVEPDLAVQAIPADVPSRALEPQAQRTLIVALYASPQGVMRMRDAVPGLVETSNSSEEIVSYRNAESGERRTEAGRRRRGADRRGAE